MHNEQVLLYAFCDLSFYIVTLQPNVKENLYLYNIYIIIFIVFSITLCRLVLSPYQTCFVDALFHVCLFVCFKGCVLGNVQPGMCVCCS